MANSTRNPDASTSTTVPAVDNAPLANVSRCVSSHFCAASAVLPSCALDRCNGPFLSQLWIWRIPSVDLAARSGNPLTNCVMTSVSVPATTTSPPTSTIAVASDRGT